MTDFKYDQFQYEEQEQDHQHQQMLNKHKQFQNNYDSLMKQQHKEENHKVQQVQLPAPIIQRQELIKKQPSHKNIAPSPKIEPKIEPVKREPSKGPPIPKPTNKEETKTKIIDQHMKLKTQLVELASKMDDIVERERQKRRKKLNTRSEEQDERVAKLKGQLKEQELEINKNKIAIDKVRKNLDYKYDVHKIVEKQNELKLLKQKVRELEKQRDYLTKINKQEKQSKDSEDTDLKRINDKMKAQISDLTQKNKSHIESINDREKQIRKLHQANIAKQQKIKQIQLKLKSKKQVPQSSDLEYNISQLQQKIKQLQEKKKEAQVQGQQRLNQINRQKKRLKLQNDKKISYLQQKQKQLKINKIQYHDIVRLINAANATKPKKQTNDDTVSKTSEKRKINKGGREKPKMPKKGEQEILENVGEEFEGKENDKGRDKVRHEIGVGSDHEHNQYQEYTNADFEEEVKDQ